MKKPVIAVAVVLLVFAGIGAYFALRSRPEAPAPAPAPVQVKSPASEPTVTVKVYHVTAEDNRESLTPVEVNVESNQTLPEAALRALVEHKSGADSGNPIPRDTRLLGLKVEESVATVDLSREFVDNFSGGSEAESFTVNAILATLGQFPEIERVKLLAEGKPIDSLGGHLDLSGSLSVIRMADAN